MKKSEVCSNIITSPTEWKVIQSVAAHFGVTPSGITGNKRHDGLVRARVAIYSILSEMGVDYVRACGVMRRVRHNAYNYDRLLPQLLWENDFRSRLLSTRKALGL